VLVFGIFKHFHFQQGIRDFHERLEQVVLETKLRRGLHVSGS
jgi:hypothetical protein